MILQLPRHGELAPNAETIHTATMTLKISATLALIGMLLLTVLLAADFINTAFGILHDVVPAIALIRSFVYLFASLSATIFFYVFGKAQSR